MTLTFGGGGMKNLKHERDRLYAAVRVCALHAVITHNDAIACRRR